jgi:sec-independent protein translocase protein TatC
VLTTVGLMRASWMRKNRRYAIFLLAIISAALPSGDVISMMIMFAALLALYEASIYVAVFVERRKAEDLDSEATTDLVDVADVEDV